MELLELVDSHQLDQLGIGTYKLSIIFADYFIHDVFIYDFSYRIIKLRINVCAYFQEGLLDLLELEQHLA